MLRSHLPVELQELAKVAEQVARDRLAPIVRQCETAGSFSPEIRRILADAGFLGLVVPPRYGGVEADLRAEMVVVEQIARVYPSAATYLTAHWTATKLLLAAARRGTEPEWLVSALGRSADGEWLGAIALTEPEAGSDLARITMRAERTDAGWSLNGTKRFITNGGFVEFYVVLVRTGGPGASGISLMFVEADRDGVVARRHEDKMGLHGSATAEMSFDGVDVPADHVLGEVDGGFGLIMAGLDEGRVNVAALSLGIAAAAMEHSVAYARDRTQFGQPISAFQGVQFMLADMGIGVAVARSIVYDAADACVRGDPERSRLASVAKTYASDMAMAATTDAVQVHGGYGYVTEFPVEMLMRDAKIHQIYEGTNQIQRVVMARALLR